MKTKKRLEILILIILIAIPGVYAYSITEFLEDITSILDGFSLTGMAILEVTDETVGTINGEPATSATPPPPTKVEGFTIVEDTTEETPEEEPVVEETTQEEQTTEEPEPEETVIEQPPEPPQTEESQDQDQDEIKHIPSCSDFIDNNINYYKKGTCKDDRGKFVDEDYPKDYCSTDRTMVMEYACNKNELCEGTWYVCPNGCKDGACIATEQEKEFNPDFKLIYINTENCQIVVTVKNVGTKSADFNIKFESEEHKETSNVDYYLNPGETVEVELEPHCFSSQTEYQVEILSEQDQNKGNNIKIGTVEATTEHFEATRITGQTAQGGIGGRETIIDKVINFFKGLFGG